MTRPLLVASLLLVASCTGKKDEERVAPPQTAPVGGGQAAPAASAAPAGSATAPAEAPPAVKLTCDRVLGKSLRDTYFAGATIVDVPQPADSAASCKVTPAGATSDVELVVTCHDNVTAAKETVLASVKDMQDLPGVGAPARTKDLGAGGTQIMAWDTDSNCQVIGTLPRAVAPADFVRDLLAALPAT